jgi:hypothetical protein
MIDPFTSLAPTAGAMVLVAVLGRARVAHVRPDPHRPGSGPSRHSQRCLCGAREHDDWR